MYLHFCLDDILIQLGGSKAEVPATLKREESFDSFTQITIPDVLHEVNIKKTYLF